MSDRCKKAKKLSAKKKKYRRCQLTNVMSEPTNSSAGNHAATTMQKFCIDSNIMLNTARKCSITGNIQFCFHLNCMGDWCRARTIQTKDAKFSLKEIESCVVRRWRRAPAKLFAWTAIIIMRTIIIVLRYRTIIGRPDKMPSICKLSARQYVTLLGMVKYSHIDRVRFFSRIARFIHYPIVECGGVLSVIICKWNSQLAHRHTHFINKCNEAIVCGISQCGNLHACLHHNEFFFLLLFILHRVCFFFFFNYWFSAVVVAANFHFDSFALN